MYQIVIKAKLKEDIFERFQRFDLPLNKFLPQLTRGGLWSCLVPLSFPSEACPEIIKWSALLRGGGRNRVTIGVIRA